MPMVEFIHGHTPYRAGETATFTPDQVTFLVGLGVAQRTENDMPEAKIQQPTHGQTAPAVPLVTRPVKAIVKKG